MQELSALEKPQAEKAVSYSMPTVVKKEKRTFAIKINRTYLTNVAAVVAAIVLSFFFLLRRKHRSDRGKLCKVTSG